MSCMADVHVQMCVSARMRETGSSGGDIVQNRSAADVVVLQYITVGGARPMLHRLSE